MRRTGGTDQIAERNIRRLERFGVRRRGVAVDGVGTRTVFGTIVVTSTAAVSAETRRTVCSGGHETVMLRKPLRSFLDTFNISSACVHGIIYCVGDNCVSCLPQCDKTLFVCCAVVLKLWCNSITLLYLCYWLLATVSEQLCCR